MSEIPAADPAALKVGQVVKVHVPCEGANQFDEEARLLAGAYGRIEAADNYTKPHGAYGRSQGLTFTVCFHNGMTAVFDALDVPPYPLEVIEGAESADPDDCNCDDRSWHGEEHDSACPLAGLPMDWNAEDVELKPRTCCETYTVEIDEPAPSLPCACSSCDWRGPFVTLADIIATCLTPGNSSPAGRCPKCEALAYPAEPEDIAKDQLDELLLHGGTVQVEAFAAALSAALGGRSVMLHVAPPAPKPEV